MLDENICPLGHKCNLTRKPYKDLEDNYIIEFKCKKCKEKGKCK